MVGSGLGLTAVRASWRPWYAARVGPAGFFPMLRRCSCVIALAVMVVGLPTAQAADTTLTLACQGTVTDGMKDAAPEKHGLPLQVHAVFELVAKIIECCCVLFSASENTIQWQPITDLA